MTATHGLRTILALAAAACLLAGLSGGLARLGLVPVLETAADFHGAFILCGFFGTLISLERAVAHGGRAALLVPGFGAAGALLLASGRPEIAAAAFLAAGLGLVALTLHAARRVPALFTAVMTVGAVLWPLGTLRWLLGESVPEVAYLWLGFLILTITAERIELSRLLRPGPIARATLIALVIAFVFALALAAPWTGSRLLAAALAGLAFWLLLNDVAVGTVRSRGLARFSAACLLSGYGWLLTASMALVAMPPAETAFGHDAAVHAIGLGFVLSMVFAHAPIILPAVVGAKVRYVPALYLPVALLQGAVVTRLAGDWIGDADLVSTGAWLTVAALALYAALLGATAIRHPAIS